MTSYCRYGYLSASIVTLSILTSGCMDVPEPYRIANATDPRYEDDDVRFRTTYYLRIIDLCPIDAHAVDRYDTRQKNWVSKSAGRYKIHRDSLYRFRMTGQARALFSNVRFESGTLRASQLDPFGHTIEFNEGKFLRAETKAVSEAASDQVRTSSSYPEATSPPTDSSPAASPTAPPKRDRGSESCPDGEPTKADYYLLGPEGAKKLDRDERLVMAMSSDAKPLVSALQFLASTVEGQDIEARLSYELEFDRQFASRARMILDEATKTDTGKPLTQQDTVTAIERLQKLFTRPGVLKK